MRWFAIDSGDIAHAAFRVLDRRRITFFTFAGWLLATSQIWGGNQSSTGQHIVDLIETGKIDVAVAAPSHTLLELTVQKLSPGELQLSIPVGTFFDADFIGTSDFVVVDTQPFPETLREPQTKIKIEALPLSIKTARHRDVQKFSVKRLPPHAGFGALVPFLGSQARPTFATANRRGIAAVQAAIWIYVDDAAYDALGDLILTSIYGYPSSGRPTRPRFISEDETAKALRLLELAGTDVTLKRVWSQRAEIYPYLNDPELIRWFEEKDPTLRNQWQAGVSALKAKVVRYHSAIEILRRRSFRIDINLLRRRASYEAAWIARYLKEFGLLVTIGPDAITAVLPDRDADPYIRYPSGYEVEAKSLAQIISALGDIEPEVLNVEPSRGPVTLTVWLK